MTGPIRPRRFIALFAAYVVALQALLLPLSVAAGSPFAGSLCVSASNDTRTPVSHDTGCACAAGCGMACATHVALTPPETSFAPVPGFVLVSIPLITLTPLEQASARHPQNPRAPPAA